MKIKELEKLLIKEGWVAVSQAGSHRKYTKNGKCSVIVPIHTGDVPIGTLNAILKQAGLK